MIKFALSLMLLLISGVSFAGTLVSPNTYRVHNVDTNVTYTTSSFDGKPHFTYQVPGKSQTFMGDQIQTQETAIGTVVTVTIRRTIDTGSTSFSLLVPKVNLPSRDATAPISVIGVVTEHRFSVVPALNRGQREYYQQSEFTGTASLTVF